MCWGMTDMLHSALLIDPCPDSTYPWVQFAWQGWHSLFASAYLKMKLLAPCRPSGHFSTQLGPSLKWRHLTQCSGPYGGQKKANFIRYMLIVSRIMMNMKSHEALYRSELYFSRQFQHHNGQKTGVFTRLVCSYLQWQQVFYQTFFFRSWGTTVNQLLWVTLLILDRLLSLSCFGVNQFF